MIDKILVPLDNSDVSEIILPYTRQLAKGLDVPLTLLSVVDWTVSRDLDERFDALLRKAEAGALARLKGIASELAEQEIEAECIVVNGHPATMIVSQAEQLGCDLIVMTTHGRHPIARGLLGSVTDEVIHTSEIPVITFTPRKAELYGEHAITITRILVPLDGTLMSETVLPTVSELAQRLAADVTLVQVVEPLQMFWIGQEPAVFEEQQTERELRTKQYLEQTANGLRADGLDVDVQLLTGHPITTLIRYVDDNPYDLIALTSHARSGIRKWFLGSVAEALIRGTGDPVMVMHPAD